MNLILNRPIVFFDVETTGLNIASDRIVEIAMLKIWPDGHQEQLVFLLNPTIPIPEASSNIHGITDEDVMGKPTFKDIAGQIQAFMKGCDLGGYNSDKFDVPILAEEFARSGFDIDLKKMNFVDAQAVFFKMEPRTLSAAYRFYCDKTLKDAHSALADVTATWEILDAQLSRYNELEPTVEGLASLGHASKFADFAGRIRYNEEGDEIFNFGKHKEKRVLDVFQREPQYYHWMMDGDFPEYTKRVITRVFLRTKPS